MTAKLLNIITMVLFILQRNLVENNPTKHLFSIIMTEVQYA